MKVARMDHRQQRRREEALMGRNRLAELLPRARASMAESGVSLHLAADLMAAGFTEADIRGAYTYYEGGGWHGKVTLAFSLEMGGGNRIGTPKASPCATEAEAEHAAVGFLAALLAVATSFAGARPDQRRRATTAAMAVVAERTGGRAAAAAPTPDEVEETVPDGAEREGGA